MSSKRVFIITLYAFATLQFIRYYITATHFYLKFSVYFAGHERIPFQERVLPIALMHPILSSHWVLSRAIHPNGIFTSPERGAFYVVSLVGFILAAIFTQKLYNAVTSNNTFGFLVYPIFLFAAIWSYIIHIEANFSYPYDMLSVGFFTAGLYCIYTRRYLPLAGIMLVGTFNRETTLFLVGIFILDGASTATTDTAAKLRQRFDFSLVSWGKAGVLLGIWLAVKLTLAHRFAHNDASENYVRIIENLARLKPRLWPSLLNVCGYLLPIVLVFRHGIRPVRFANYLYILPAWFAVMFYTGVIVETRIYGELCSLVAVSMVLIIEQYALTLPHSYEEDDAAPPLVAPSTASVLP